MFLTPTPTTPPRLLTRSPSPTTVEYTVTTAPLPPASRTLRYVLFTIHVCVRFLLLGMWVGVAGGKYWLMLHERRRGEVEVGDGGGGGGGGSLGYVVEELVRERLCWWHILVCGVVTVVGVGRRGYSEDTLLILRNLGIQTRTIPATTFSLLPPSWTWFTPTALPFLTPPSPTTSSLPARAIHALVKALTGSGGGTTRFIPTSQVQDVWIHEGFAGFEVRFYLGVVVCGEEELVVVFERTRPRRRVVETVWRGVRRCLYERRGGKGETGVEKEKEKGRMAEKVEAEGEGRGGESNQEGNSNEGVEKS
ncbi:GPI-GlcNAc transferase complex, PIG-H component-domain-containing protein [Peziza echinospora]|nr:GPI-GlcNAc transferase complex, PIG-H component-domain-containing protein [Peziza echinospora]